MNNPFALVSSKIVRDPAPLERSDQGQEIPLEIPENEVQFSELSRVDPVGRVFQWKERLYRGIFPDYADQTRTLFASGVLDELADRHLFPRSRVTGHQLAGFGLVVEHEKIPFVTYPYEWSFTMFQDAALAVLDVVGILEKRGWRLKDYHPYNILFRNGRALWIDLGSILPLEGKHADIPLDFLTLYWQPLWLWSRGERFLAQRIISSGYETLPAAIWHFLRHPRLFLAGRWIGKALSRSLDRWCFRQASRLRHLRPGKGLISFLERLLPAEALIKNRPLLRRKIAALRPATNALTAWGSYHEENFREGALVSNPRFDRILEIIDQLGCESAVDLAGNQGVVSLLMMERTAVRRVACLDRDWEAVNRAHLRCQDLLPPSSSKIFQSAIVDLIVPEGGMFERRPMDRFRSDVALALAVTHHLTLSDGFPIEEVLRMIAKYTRRFVIIEFMPLGLWNGTGTPTVPDWYKEEWFERAFRRFFDVVQREELEINRILYVGRLKEADQK